jgi:hypothetical protein
MKENAKPIVRRLIFGSPKSVFIDIPARKIARK